MAVAWTYNNIRIFPSDYTPQEKQIIARLSPLGGGTVHHFFGYESGILKLKVFIAGYANYDALKACTRTGVSYALNMSSTTSLGNFFLNSMSGTWINTSCQTFDPSQASDAIVYSLDLEFYHDESST
jgi:hypothetical protein